MTVCSFILSTIFLPSKKVLTYRVHDVNNCSKQLLKWLTIDRLSRPKNSITTSTAQNLDLLDGMKGFCYDGPLRNFISNLKERTMTKTFAVWLAALILSTSLGCAGGGLTTREKGAGIGALGGAAAGGIIGAAVGHPGAGAAIGGVLGLGTGALVGDQLQGQEVKQSDQQRQINTNQAELDRQRRELEQLKRQQSEY
jgi:hypothetical protein